MSDTTVLMYHAVLADPSQAMGADAHYTVSTREFERQLDTFIELGVSARSIRDLIGAADTGAPSVAVTFDDGHISNLQNVLPLLVSREMTADFFVNSTTVGDDHMMSWYGLREMSEAGMSIQSHGRTHVYLDDLAPEDIDTEIAGSKQDIEDQLGREVVLFAPPNGRFNARVIASARRAGYQAVCCSRPGRWEGDRDIYVIPRVAVLGSTSLDTVSGWVRGKGLAAMTFRYRVLGAAKAALGNRNYERLRNMLLRTGGGA